MSKQVKNIIGFIALFIFILWVIYKLIGSLYGYTLQYEFILAIAIGIFYVFLIILEKDAKNRLRKAVENYDFEQSRKIEHEIEIEIQKAVFSFIPKEYIRRDVGRSVEEYSYTKDFNRSKENLDKINKRLSDIELCIMFLQVITFVVGVLYFTEKMKNAHEEKRADIMERLIDYFELSSVRDSVKLFKIKHPNSK